MTDTTSLSADLLALEDEWTIPTYSKLPMAFARGEGIRIWDTDDTEYLDFYGGHCVTILGHCHPAITQAITQQANELLFYSNVAYSPVRARAAERLGRMAPEGLGHSFFCNSGTEANETALKLARAHTGRPRIVAMEAGFHGRTMGSLAVTHGDKYHAPYRSALDKTTFIPFGDLDAARDTLDETVAAVIIEPIQSMAGMTTAPDAYFHGLRAACDAVGALLIFDEVQTGVGRVGRFSISENIGVKPDLISLAKSLGGGVPIGAVLASDEIAAGVKSGDQGTTFGGGMLAMAAMTAVLETIERDHLMERSCVIQHRITQAVDGIAREVRGGGALLGIDLGRPAAPVVAALRKRGILSGGSGDPNTLRLMPPLTTPDWALDAFAERFPLAFADAYPEG